MAGVAGLAQYNNWNIIMAVLCFCGLPGKRYPLTSPGKTTCARIKVNLILMCSSNATVTTYMCLRSKPKGGIHLTKPAVVIFTLQHYDSHLEDVNLINNHSKPY